MRPKDAIGILLVATGLVLLALEQFYGLAPLIIGILLIYLSKRRRQIDDTLDDLPFPGDGDYLSGSHGADLPDD